MRHSFVSSKPEGPDSSIVSKNEWNSVHLVVPTQISADYAVLDTDDLIEGTSGASDITATLPPLASVAAGRPYEIIKVDSGAGRVILKGNGSELINASNTWALVSQYQFVQVYANAARTAWLIRGGN